MNKYKCMRCCSEKTELNLDTSMVKCLDCGFTIPLQLIFNIQELLE